MNRIAVAPDEYIQSSFDSGGNMVAGSLMSFILWSLVSVVTTGTLISQFWGLRFELQ